jgi:hypothetical protein
MDSVKQFFDALKVQIPAGVVLTYPATGKNIDSATGNTTGIWTTPQLPTTTGTGSGPYAGNAGACFNWHTGLYTGGKELRGKTFIVPFRVHHTDPVDITRHGFIATNGHTCLTTIPLLVGMLFVDVHSRWGAAVLAFMTVMTVGVFLTNQFHKWAHEKEVGPVVGLLQRLHLVLGREHHDLHHTRPYDQAYCITTGWLNPLLTAIRFFRVAEWVITKATGVEPRKDDLTTA